jgi:hypothetical protein
MSEVIEQVAGGRTMFAELALDDEVQVDRPRRAEQSLPRRSGAV